MELNIADKNSGNWCLILVFNETSDYLIKNDLIQLSIANKFLRKKLKFKLFYHINFIKYPKNLDKFTYLKHLKGEEQIKGKVDEFIKEFHLISLFVNELSIGDYFNLYLLNPTISICPKLSQINFNLMHIPLTTLKQVLESCKCLEGLLLQFVKVVEWTHSPITVNELVLPSTLKSLIIRSSFLERSPLEEDPMVIDYIYYGRTLFINKLNLFKCTSPKLELVELNGYGDYDIIDINQFLIAQDKVKCLSIQGNIINQATFDALSNLPNLKTFTILGSDYNTNWKSANIPSLNQLKSLSIFYPSFYSTIGEDFTSKFPNLTQLTTLYNEKFVDQVLNHPGLQKLTIYYQYLTKFNHILPINNLKYFELGLKSPLNINFNSILNCKKLKILKISLNQQTQKICSDEVSNYYKMLEGWRCKPSINHILCYKLRNSSNK